MENKTRITATELTFVRVINAPREIVWRAWTEKEHLAYWWGPNGFTNTIHEMDVRPGGLLRLTMHGPGGEDYHNRMRYTELVWPERIEYVHLGEDEDDPDAFRVTVTFEKSENKTKLVMRVHFPSEEELARAMREHKAEDGGNQALARLEDYLMEI